jgi:hypothetical protein
MKSLRVLFFSFLSASMLMATGCDTDRISKLEKENQELKEKLSAKDTAQIYEMQAKCGKDAKEWFRDNYSQDKDYLSQLYIDHYNKKLNVCFIRTADQLKIFDNSTSWHTSIWNVYENSLYADLEENHDSNNKDKPDTVDICDVQGKKCSNRSQFDQMTSSLMND